METSTVWDPRTSDAYSSPTAVSQSTPQDTSNDSTSHKNWSLYQNYFAFLGVVIVIAIVAAFVIHRRKRQAAYHMRTSRQIALSRDIEDANLRRGWGWGALSRDYASGPTAHGRSHDNFRIGMTPWRRRQEEGLNEAGEAPPPYKSGPDAQDTVLETGRPHNNDIHPAVPPPTLDREQAGLKPPNYTATMVSPVTSEGHPSASSSANATSTALNAASAPAANTNNDVHDQGDGSVRHERG